MLLDALPRSLYYLKREAGFVTILGPQHEQIVRRAIDSGRYSSAEEVLDAALMRLEEEELVRQVRLDRLREEIDLGLQQVERGAVKAFDPAEMKRRVRAASATDGPVPT